MTGRPKLRGYTIERLLGAGGSGQVWQARVGSGGPRVALKFVPAAGDEQRRRAQAEAGLLTALEHPNVVRLHTLVPADDQLALVLDLAEGGSLADLLAARGRLTPGEVITAIAPLAAALAYLHGEGVVHGDVSAANVLFTAAGTALLADVGVARLTGDRADAAATPAYVDPAVAAGCVPGPPSDVFMLAGVALHALTGAPTWPGDAAAALATAAAGRLDDVEARLAQVDVPPAMSATLRRALSVDPQRRGTAADLALDLRHSATPLAVELAAGRARREARLPRSGPRHAARQEAGDDPPPDPPPDQPPVDPSRPGFTRPGLRVEAAAAPPTRIVAPRPRPPLPRSSRRPWYRGSPRWLVGGLAALLVVGAVTAGLAWSSPTSAPATAPTATPIATPTATPIATPIATPTATPTATAGATDWPAVLGGLDSVRARAFATRDAALLRRVYSPGALLTADTALLVRVVPPGCGLAGVRTRYTGVRARARGARVVVTATATLPPSRLICHGAMAATAPGTGPTALQVELTRTADGLRITGQRPARADPRAGAARPAAPSRGRGG